MRTHTCTPAFRGQHDGRVEGRRFVRGRFLAALAVVAAGMCFPASAAASYSVSLTRTTGGVANISGENFADAGFGVGYAQAQDGICLLAETFLTVDGERSAFLGPEGVFKNEAEGGLQFTNLNSDVYWTSIKDQHTVRKLLKLPYPQGPSTEGREAVSGYAAGYDAYLKQIGGASGVTNPACKGAAWVRPIKPIDVWLRIYQVDDLAGNSALGPYAEANPEYGPPADPSAESAQGHNARKASIGSISIGLPAPIGHSNLLGSNGLAVGSEDATNGGGVVLANPHFPWHGAERFWEMNVEVPGQYHAIGAGIWGLPGINIGHNQDVAWTHTVSTNTTVTLWYLSPIGLTKYYYKGKKVAIKTHKVTVEALEHGELVPHTRTLYYSVYGPVIWEDGNAIAVDDANANNLRGVNQWLAISKAENASQVIESERAIQGVPWVNTIGADDQGNAFYTEIVVASSLTKAYLDSYCNLRARGKTPARSWAPVSANCPKARVRSCRASLRAATSRRWSAKTMSRTPTTRSGWRMRTTRSPGSRLRSAAKKKTRACALRRGSTWSPSAWAPTTAASRPTGSRRRPDSQPKRCRTRGPVSRAPS